MMKCPICQKRIPIGEEWCPHCGAKVESKSLHKRDRQSIFSQVIQRKKSKKILFIVIAIVVILMGASDILRYEKDHQIRISHETTELPFIQLMDNEAYEENKEVLQLAQKEKENMLQFLKDNHFHEIKDVSYTKRIGYSFVAVAVIQFEKDNVSYDIYKKFASDDTFKNTIGMSLKLNTLEGMDKETYLSQEDIDLIAQYLKIDDAYHDLNEVKKRMNKEQNEYMNEIINNKEITVNQSFDEESKSISITFNICQDYKE